MCRAPSVEMNYEVCCTEEGLSKGKPQEHPCHSSLMDSLPCLVLSRGRAVKMQTIRTYLSFFSNQFHMIIPSLHGNWTWFVLVLNHVNQTTETYHRDESHKLTCEWITNFCVAQTRGDIVSCQWYQSARSRRYTYWRCSLMDRVCKDTESRSWLHEHLGRCWWHHGWRASACLTSSPSATTLKYTSRREEQFRLSTWMRGARYASGLSIQLTSSTTPPSSRHGSCKLIHQSYP